MPTRQDLADVIMMLCIRPAEADILLILRYEPDETDHSLYCTGLKINREILLNSDDFEESRTSRELLTRIQNATLTGKPQDPAHGTLKSIQNEVVRNSEIS
ncbi:hypothetical protein Glove_276g70 [Diversispora epigaea]|uniref:Uncharacterized protein n=1 Tax=Diversispora epigaea TaxID=1348612 RepID=A0A397IA10_9GLOM|nr:hypothetical protein Glove_276g70 [Diversispora epigaea]